MHSPAFHCIARLCFTQKKGKHSRICTLPVSYIADTPWSGCYPLGYRFGRSNSNRAERNTLKRPTVTNNDDRRSRRLTVMRMLRQNTRAPSPRRLRDRLHARSTLAKVGFLACLHAISLERSRFRKNAQLKSKISQP